MKLLEYIAAISSIKVDSTGKASVNIRAKPSLFSNGSPNWEYEGAVNKSVVVQLFEMAKQEVVTRYGVTVDIVSVDIGHVSTDVKFTLTHRDATQGMYSISGEARIRMPEGWFEKVGTSMIEHFESQDKAHLSKLEGRPAEKDKLYGYPSTI